MIRKCASVLACILVLGFAGTVRAAAPATKPAAPAAAAALVDINSASKEDLMKLPSIGEAIANKIVAGRPWANKSQLLSKKLLTKAAYDKVAPLIVARQASK